MKYTKPYTQIFKKILLISITVAVLVFSACSNNIADSQGAVIDEIPVVTLPPVEKEPVPAVGGELVFAIPENPATINPLLINNVELCNLMNLIYEQPVRIDTDGKAVSELAETWQADVTGTIWTFDLRKGVNWQNGYGSFTSADVKYTIDLIMSYTTEESRYAVYNSYIASYEATDTYKITITLNEPSNVAIYFMTMPIVCEAYLAEHDFDTDLPVGTGPYTADSYDKREGMELSASDVWWKQSPYIQKLSAVCYSDHEAELYALDSNLLDFVTTSIIAIEPYIKYGKTESIDYITQYYDCLIPNVAEGILSDVRTRQAIAFALDKRDIISEELLGHAVATDYPIPLSSFLSGGSTNIYEYNIQKAIDLLGEAGWKNRDEDPVFESVENSLLNDLEIDLLIYKNDEDTYRRDVADNIAEQLLSCGISVNVLEVSYDDYAQRLGNHDFDLALCSFYLDKNPDPTFLIGTGGSANYGKFSDSVMDQLLVACKTATNDEDMVTAYLAMEDYFIQQVPHIGLYFRTHSMIFDSAITTSSSLRDLNVYATIPKWYLYVEED